MAEHELNDSQKAAKEWRERKFDPSIHEFSPVMLPDLDASNPDAPQALYLYDNLRLVMVGLPRDPSLPFAGLYLEDPKKGLRSTWFHTELLAFVTLPGEVNEPAIFRNMREEKQALTKVMEWVKAHHNP